VSYPRVARNYEDNMSDDDAVTVCAISILAAILANVLHEGLGHAATSLLTGAKSGMLTTVAWSSGLRLATGCRDNGRMDFSQCQAARLQGLSGSHFLG